MNPKAFCYGRCTSTWKDTRREWYPEGRNPTNMEGYQNGMK
jgi:hypothetical protein